MKDMVYCRGCGKEIHESALSCPHCGAEQVLTPAGGRNRVAAALFAIFFGFIGIQKFYLGKTGQGILCVLFFWTCIPAIIGVIDFILLLTMTESEFQKKYNKPA